MTKFQALEKCLMYNVISYGITMIKLRSPISCLGNFNFNLNIEQIELINLTLFFPFNKYYRYRVICKQSRNT